MATALKPEKTSGESIGVRKLPPETPARDAQSEEISNRASICWECAAAAGVVSARIAPDWLAPAGWPFGRLKIFSIGVTPARGSLLNWPSFRDSAPASFP